MKRKIFSVTRCKFMSVTLISFFTLLLFNTSCSSSADIQQSASASNQNQNALPYLEETKPNGEKVYLESVMAVNKEDQSIQQLLSTGYLNDKIGAHDVFVEYTLLDKTQKDQPATRQSYIARYIPTGYGDYHVSRIHLPVATLDSSSSTSQKPVWENEGMLSSKKNTVECDALKIYRTKEI